MTRFNIRNFGAKGDGYQDDSTAIQAATLAALGCNGAVYVPPGSYLCQQKIFFPATAANISFEGDGSNVSVLYGQNCQVLDFNFSQNEFKQPYGLTMRNVGFRALGTCERAVRVSYGQPAATNDHDQPSLTISNVMVASSGEGAWSDGIELEGAWNATLDNVFISGNSFGGDYSKLAGAGVRLKGYCVNLHATNVRTNWFADGWRYDGTAYGNTEGLHFANCSGVGVRRIMTINGSALAAAPRVSTVTWVGGLVDARVKGADYAAAFNFSRVWTVLITGCQMIAETLDTGELNTYGVSAADCRGVVVTCCDINAWRFGVATSGECEAISTHGNTFTNTACQTVFNKGTRDSRSYGHVLVDLVPDEKDLDGRNMMGFTNQPTNFPPPPFSGAMS